MVWHAACINPCINQGAARGRTDTEEIEDMDHTMDNDAPYRRSGYERVFDRLTAYLGSRTGDHWIMFVAGLVIGLVLG